MFLFNIPTGLNSHNYDPFRVTLRWWRPVFQEGYTVKPCANMTDDGKTDKRSEKPEGFLGLFVSGTSVRNGGTTFECLVGVPKGTKQLLMETGL